MRERLESLERQVEAELASVRDLLPEEPPLAVVERVKAAVRHELNELWLESQPVPQADSEAMARVRVAVGQELARRDARFRRTLGSAGGTWRSARPVWMSLLAAAAVIVLGVGVIRYAGTSASRQVAQRGVSRVAKDQDIQRAEQAVELFIAAAKEILAEDAFVASARMDLEAIEENVDISRAALDSNEEALDELGDEIDELFVEFDPWAA